jgi:hypothetical protein
LFKNATLSGELSASAKLTLGSGLVSFTGGISFLKNKFSHGLHFENMLTVFLNLVVALFRIVIATFEQLVVLDAVLGFVDIPI